jgi:hypothetical protein
VVTNYAIKAVDILLPELEKAFFDDRSINSRKPRRRRFMKRQPKLKELHWWRFSVRIVVTEFFLLCILHDKMFLALFA